MFRENQRLRVLRPLTQTGDGETATPKQLNTTTKVLNFSTCDLNTIRQVYVKLFVIIFEIYPYFMWTIWYIICYSEVT